MNICFFSPFARVLPHSISEATIIRELERDSHKVQVISCGKVFKGQCITLDAFGLRSATKNRIEQTCNECVSCSQSLYPNALELASFLGENRLAIESQIDELLKELTPENFIKFEYEGFPIGKLAAYQHLINLKKFSPEISQEEFPLFLREVRNCLLVIFGLNVFWERSQFNPDVVMTYNSLYSVNAIFCEFFSRKGARVYSLHHGPNLHHFQDTMVLMPQHTFNYLNILKQKFNLSNGNLTEESIENVLDHFKELSLGRSVFAYSKKVDHSKVPNILEKFKIRPDRKVVLAAMSSYDERFAAEYCGSLNKSKDNIFSTQIAWIEWLLNFARTRDDIHLIVRLHPREFPNKREGLLSHHSQVVLQALKDRPPNVSVNTPEDELSLYDIARETDVALTAWSSVGKELLLFGIPLVLYTADSQGYPASLAKSARNLNEYERMIDQALTEGWSIRNSVQVLKWLVFETYENPFQLTTRQSPSRRIRIQNLGYRILSKLFGPAFLINLRVGRIKESQVFLKCLETGKLKSEFSAIISHGESIEEVTRVMEYLPILGKIMFGPNKDRWPNRFTKMFKKGSLR